jgi:hypothetical protein
LPFRIVRLHAVPELIGELETLLGRQLQQLVEGLLRNRHMTSVPDASSSGLLADSGCVIPASGGRDAHVGASTCNRRRPHTPARSTYRSRGRGRSLRTSGRARAPARR